jgi:hypothetical protein
MTWHDMLWHEVTWHDMTWQVTCNDMPSAKYSPLTCTTVLYIIYIYTHTHIYIYIQTYIYTTDLYTSIIATVFLLHISRVGGGWGGVPEILWQSVVHPSRRFTVSITIKTCSLGCNPLTLYIWDVSMPVRLRRETKLLIDYCQDIIWQTDSWKFANHSTYMSYIYSI